MLRVRIRDFELPAEQVLFPVELGSAQIGHALGVDEHLDVLFQHNDVGGPGRIGEVHSVLHPATAARDDSQAEGGAGPVLLFLKDPDAAHRGLGDDRRFWGTHQRDRVSDRSNAGPTLKSSAAIHVG